MAGSFGCDPQVARQMSGELGNIRTSLDSLGAAFDALSSATGSSDVQGALDDFVHDSSDARKKIDNLLARSSGLLGGLAAGTEQVDTSLAGALGPAAAGGPGPAAAPATLTRVPVAVAAAVGGAR